MKSFRRTALIALAALAATPARADIACDLTVSGLALSGDGWLQVWFSTDTTNKYWWWCPVAGSTVVNDGYSANRTIPSDACKAIFSQMLTAKSSGKKIRLVYHGPVDCPAVFAMADGTPTLFPSLIQLVQ